MKSIDDKIKVNIRYGYEPPFLSVCLENPKSERFCKVKDMEHFNLWCAGKKALRNKGAKIRVDTEIKKRAKCISQYHGYGYWGGLEFVTDIYNTGLKFEFFQNVTVPENKNGGRYDFDKYSKFPYLIRLRLKIAIKTLIEEVSQHCDATITCTDAPISAEQRILKKFKEFSFSRNRINTIDEIESFMSHYDFSKNSNDRDKKKIKCGELKYFYSYDGYLHRGQVYHNINNMWWVIENDSTLRNIASHELFDRTNEPARRVLSSDRRLDKLSAELNRQIKAKNFIRCNEIQKQINSLKQFK